MKKRIRGLNVCLTLVMTLGFITTLFALPGERPVSASVDPGVIAYVLPNDKTGDEIHLIEPDGTGDQKIWSTGQPGAELVQDVHSLTWRPDASELAFVSSFQATCSIYNEDVYTVRADGTGLRRQTAPFGCGPNPGLPTGTVVLTVVNYVGDGTFIVYIQGAPKAQTVVLGYGASQTLTFNNVMDYGDGVAQWAVGIWGLNRFMDISSHADVLPGETVYATLGLSPFSPSWSSPTYSGDGQNMAYIASPNIAYYTPSNHTTPGGIGSYWQPGGASMTDSPSHLHWIGNDPANSKLLYLGYDFFSGDGFYLADHEGSMLLTEVDTYSVFGMDKLPDNSGLIYSAVQTFQTDECVVQSLGNIFEYKFATGKTTQLSHFAPRPPTGDELCPPGPFPYEVTISPDGSQIAFELQSQGDWTDPVHMLDLWIMNHDGSHAHELVPGGLSPAWSPMAIPDPGDTPPGAKKVFLPAVLNH